MQNFYLKSFDDTNLYIHLCDEVENPIGVVQIAHGMGEHGGRYGSLAQRLNKAGFICFADDHRAHGLTESDKDRGWHKGNIFGDTVKDLVYLHLYFKNKYQLPMYYIGHSYGSFLGQSFLQQGTEVKGVILSGSAKMDSNLMGLGIFATAGLKLVAGRWRPRFIALQSQKVLNKLLPVDEGDAGRRWLTRDIEERKKNVEDRISCVDMSINFNYNMMRGIRKTNKEKNQSRLNPYTRILIISGADDPISNAGKLIPVLAEHYKSHGVLSVESKLYEGGRHEVFFETNREEVYDYVIDWLLRDFK